ncbi:hypothetical protein D9M73_265920 [compost metagenome]
MRMTEVLAALASSLLRTGCTSGTTVPAAGYRKRPAFCPRVNLGVATMRARWVRVPSPLKCQPWTMPAPSNQWS